MEGKSKCIVYIGSFDRLWNEEGNARAFEKLGYEVHRFSEKNFDHREVITKIREIKPDFLIFAKLKIIAKDSFISAVKKLCPTVCWTFDLYFGYIREKLITEDYAFKANYVFSPDGGHNEGWKRLGINHYLLRQGICDEYCYLGEKDKKYDYDVVFVGGENPHWIPRSEMCSFLLKEYGDRFRWFGRDYTLDVRGDELNKLYNTAKVVVGDSVFSPYYFSNRIFETIGRGGFMMHMDVTGLNDCFVPYKHYIPFKLGDHRGLKEKIDYFLRKPKKRDQIRLEAFKHTKENHTLVHRCKKLLEIL